MAYSKEYRYREAKNAMRTVVDLEDKLHEDIAHNRLTPAEIEQRRELVREAIESLVELVEEVA